METSTLNNAISTAKNAPMSISELEGNVKLLGMAIPVKGVVIAGSVVLSVAIIWGLLWLLKKFLGIDILSSIKGFFSKLTTKK